MTDHLERDGPDGDMEEAERLYQVYCEPGFIGEPIAFGGDSSHDPSRCDVLEDISGIEAVLKTSQ